MKSISIMKTIIALIQERLQLFQKTVVDKIDNSLKY